VSGPSARRASTPSRASARDASFAGVVPSAGASVRMGSPKALLRVEGESFLERTARTLRGGGCDPVFVVVALGDAAAEQEAARSGARVLTNPDPGEGPITSLRLALAELDPGAAGLVYLPVDHPLVRPETVATLLDAAGASAAPLTLPVHGGERGHPAVFGAALFGELSDPALEGGARTVTHRHLDEALLVEVDDPGVLTDIDTPEIYEAAIGGRPRPGDARR
jgi:molybdenum cofactor cytidylyltransferase